MVKHVLRYWPKPLMGLDVLRSCVLVVRLICQFLVFQEVSRWNCQQQPLNDRVEKGQAHHSAVVVEAMLGDFAFIPFAHALQKHIELWNHHIYLHCKTHWVIGSSQILTLQNTLSYGIITDTDIAKHIELWNRFRD